MGIMGKIKNELLVRIIGKFKSIMYSSLVTALSQCYWLELLISGITL